MGQRLRRTGLTTGYPDNTFRPYNQITRQQVITMVVRAGGADLENPPSDWAGVLSYSDPTHGANIRKAEFNHLLDGLENLSYSYNAALDATRGECAQLLYNLVATAGGGTSSTTSTTYVPGSTTTTAAPTTTTTTTAPKTPQPLELLESGYTVTGGTPYVEYAVIIRNPNLGFGAIFPTVRITMRDAAGGVLGVTNQVLNQIRPGETLKWGGQANPNGTRPASVQFEAVPPGKNWKPADQMVPPDFEPFEIVGLRKNGTGYSIKFTGELMNRNSWSFTLVAVSVLLRNQAGRLVAGYTSFVSTVLPGGQVPFEVMTLGAVPDYASIEAYAQIWLE